MFNWRVFAVLVAALLLPGLAVADDEWEQGQEMAAPSAPAPTSPVTQYIPVPGPQGPRGERGPAGPAGPRGPRGQSGSRWRTGARTIRSYRVNPALRRDVNALKGTIAVHGTAIHNLQRNLAWEAEQRRQGEGRLWNSYDTLNERVTKLEAGTQAPSTPTTPAPAPSVPTTPPGVNGPQPAPPVTPPTNGPALNGPATPPGVNGPAMNGPATPPPPVSGGALPTPPGFEREPEPSPNQVPATFPGGTSRVQLAAFNGNQTALLVEGDAGGTKLTGPQSVQIKFVYDTGDEGKRPIPEVKVLLVGNGASMGKICNSAGIATFVLQPGVEYVAHVYPPTGYTVGSKRVPMSFETTSPLEVELFTDAEALAKAVRDNSPAALTSDQLIGAAETGAAQALAKEPKSDNTFLTWIVVISVILGAIGAIMALAQIKKNADTNASRVSGGIMFRLDQIQQSLNQTAQRTNTDPDDNGSPGNLGI